MLPFFLQIFGTDAWQHLILSIPKVNESAIVFTKNVLSALMYQSLSPKKFWNQKKLVRKVVRCVSVLTNTHSVGVGAATNTATTRADIVNNYCTTAATINTATAVMGEVKPK